MLIKVTQAHIDNAKYNDGYSCPIANACNDTDAFEHDIGQSKVFVQVSRVWKWKSTVGYKLPLVARYFIQAFDARRKVEPFEFEIDLDQPKFR
jgi:hypothetical protein